MINVNPDWEDGHFYIGKYYDKIITTLLEDKHDKERINPAKQWSEFFCSVPLPLPSPTTLGNGQYLMVTLFIMQLSEIIFAARIKFNPPQNTIVRIHY